MERNKSYNVIDGDNQRCLPDRPPPDYGTIAGSEVDDPLSGISRATDGVTQPSSTGDKLTFEQAFRIEQPQWNDVWAMVLFLVVFCCFAAVSVTTLAGDHVFDFRSEGFYNDNSNFGINKNVVTLFTLVLTVALVFGWGYILLARAYTAAFIWITGILHVVFGLAIAIYMLCRQDYFVGIIFLIFGLFGAFCFYTWIPRIPFSVIMLQTSIDVARNYGHVYIVSFVGGLLATAFGAWYIITLVAIYMNFMPGNDIDGRNPACLDETGGCSGEKVIGLFAFITFALFWTSEVLKNTIHAIISGVYGSWFFSPQNIPRNPTLGAFKRATTTSFGSICFGSLIVAIINSLRQLCSIAQSQAQSEDDIVGAVLLCVLGSLIDILDWAVEFLNRYAFSHIALYGKPYIASAQDTWRMIKDRGMDALVNECLIEPVLTMGAVAVGTLCASLAYIYLAYTAPKYNNSGGFTAVIVAFAFLVGLQITSVFTTPLSSGIDTIFVASAWDPEVQMREHPDLYASMVAVYPEMQSAIHG